jgi:hypothetical protein
MDPARAKKRIELTQGGSTFNIFSSLGHDLYHSLRAMGVSTALRKSQAGPTRSSHAATTDGSIDFVRMRL